MSIYVIPNHVLITPPPPQPFMILIFDSHLDFVLLDPREVSRQLPDKRSVTLPPPPLKKRSGSALGYMV